VVKAAAGAHHRLVSTDWTVKMPGLDIALALSASPSLPDRQTVDLVAVPRVSRATNGVPSCSYGDDRPICPAPGTPRSRVAVDDDAQRDRWHAPADWRRAACGHSTGDSVKPTR